MTDSMDSNKIVVVAAGVIIIIITINVFINK